VSELPPGWEWTTLGNLATSFVDGPFGSKLKTEHYTSDGVRVIRLQNIGDGRFLDDDKAFISPEHAANLLLAA
jgi:type I restriction enzyme S subunit